jgi:hypothetical protein
MKCGLVTSQNICVNLTKILIHYTSHFLQLGKAVKLYDFIVIYLRSIYCKTFSICVLVNCSSKSIMADISSVKIEYLSEIGGSHGCDYDGIVGCDALGSDR